MQECGLITAWDKYKKITQKELASKSGITQAALSQIEKVDSKPQKRTLEKIAKAHNLTTDQIRELTYEKTSAFLARF